jgi:hypothetical protein
VLEVARITRQINVMREALRLPPEPSKTLLPLLTRIVCER